MSRGVRKLTFLIYIIKYIYIENNFRFLSFFAFFGQFLTLDRFKYASDKIKHPGQALYGQ